MTTALVSRLRLSRTKPSIHNRNKCTCSRWLRTYLAPSHCLLPLPLLSPLRHARQPPSSFTLHLYSHQIHMQPHAHPSLYRSHFVAVAGGNPHRGCHRQRCRGRRSAPRAAALSSDWGARVARLTLHRMCCCSARKSRRGPPCSTTPRRAPLGSTCNLQETM